MKSFSFLFLVKNTFHPFYFYCIIILRESVSRIFSSLCEVRRPGIRESFVYDETKDSFCYSDIVSSFMLVCAGKRGCVRNRQIFAMPAEKDPWDLPGLSCMTGTAFMLRKMYPDRFSAEDLEDHADSYYRFMFGRCFDKELELDYKSY